MIRVLIVDDSAIIRRVLSQEVSKDPEIEVVGTAPNPYVARDLIVERRPDVVTLDIEMPRMDGITFLHKLMHYHPIPVVVVSSLTPKGGDLALEALQAGAVEVMCKPGGEYTIEDMSVDLIQKLKAAANVNVKQGQRVSKLADNKTAEPDLKRRPGKILAVGASTGGTIALEFILRSMPENAPAMLITQHMPALFTHAFAERLNRFSKMKVREATQGDPLEPGLALVAPGDHHLILRERQGQFCADVRRGPRVKRHRPSVDVMFLSVAKVAKEKAIGLLLTGMGDDGANGLLEMKKAGAMTIAQNEASCVVFGMPRVAIGLGAVDEVLNLRDIPERILTFAEK